MTTEIDPVLRRCERTWLRLRVEPQERASMMDELRTDLEQATRDGIGPMSFLGGDIDGFARAWASERGTVRPRPRLGSTAAIACLSMVPGAAFAAVLPLLSTSEWGLTLLVDVFPGQRANTNLDCFATGDGGCGSVSWSVPGWLILGWYVVAIAIMFLGALAGSSAWLRRRADPLRPSTLRWLTVSLPLAGLALGACLLALDSSDNTSFDVGNGTWAPIMAFGVFVTVMATRALVVARARGSAPPPAFS